MVGHPGPERVVLGAVGGLLAGALLVLVGAAAGVLASAARGRRRRLHGVAADPSPARGLRQAFELVGGLVDGLQVALVLVAAPGRGDVRMPALGHPPPRKLDGALIERGLQFEEEQCGFYVQDARHDR